MIDTRVVKDASKTVDLCETFTDNEEKVLKQLKTGYVYGSSVVDVIAGFKEDGKPYSRYKYVEVDKPKGEDVNSPVDDLLNFFDEE